MLKILKTLMLISFSSSAFAANFTCEVDQNTTLSTKQTVSVPAGGTATFGAIQDYHFTLNDKGGGFYEIQTADSGAEARYYSEGSLKTANDHLKWSLWSRDVLLEVNCALAP